VRDLGVLALDVAEQVRVALARRARPVQLARRVTGDVMDDVAGEGGERPFDAAVGFLAEVVLDDLRQRQVQAARRAVLDAARELFTTQGYGATTAGQIAQRAGVSKPTVFSAVGSKQMVLRAVRDAVIAGAELLAQHLTGVPAGMPRSTRCSTPRPAAATRTCANSGRQNRTSA
jgi:Bacterial regulatory proteins, tetR family